MRSTTKVRLSSDIRHTSQRALAAAGAKGRRSLAGGQAGGLLLRCIDAPPESRTDRRDWEAPRPTRLPGVLLPQG